MADQKILSTRDQISNLILDGRYGESFRICETVVRQKEKDPFYHLAGAVSLLGLGHIRQAEEWLDKQDSSGPEYLYVEADVCLHAGRIDDALLAYTQIIDEDPSDTFADKLIERLRADPDDIQREINREHRVERYIPIRAWFSDRGKLRNPGLYAGKIRKEKTGLGFSPGKVVSWIVNQLARLPILVRIAVPLVLIAIIFSVYWIRRGDPFRDLADKLPEAPVQGTIVPMKDYKGSEPRFVFEDRKSVVELFQTARSQILEGKVNQARMLLNQIQLSNAGFEIKDRAALLEQMIPVIPPAYFRDNLEIQKLLDDPELMRGVQVYWPGTVDTSEPGRMILATAGGKALITGRIPPKLVIGEPVQVIGFFTKVENEVPVILAHEIQR